MVIRKLKWVLIVESAIILVGCSTVSESSRTVIKDDSIKVEREMNKPSDESNNSIDNDAETGIEADDDNSVSESLGAGDGLYDRTYLEEKDGVYVYRMSDQDIIKKYDELYAAAFTDVVESYRRVTELQKQSFSIDQPVAFTNLVMNNDGEMFFMNTGSYYEWDYNFDLNNVGYTYVDLDSDGVFELIFGVISYDDAEWIPEDYFERAYGLADGSIVKFCEGGSRDLHWLGSDGCIYETGSGGAAYNGTWRLHFDSSQLKAGENVDWGSNGFVQDEFLGFWEAPVHISDPVTDIDEQSKLPQYQLSEDDIIELREEWEVRKVRIDWMRMEYTL